MASELISKRTRYEFREFLVGWTLNEIEIEFGGANINFDRNYKPDVSGQRRIFVEQHFYTLDFTKPDNVRRLITAFQSIIERAEDSLQIAPNNETLKRDIETLKKQLRKDGLVYKDGIISAITQEANIIFESKRSITEFTRRAIFDILKFSKFAWWGRLSEPDFLGRIFDLPNLPSYDGRFKSMDGDIKQHRERGSDWNDDWIFTDNRLNLIGTADNVFLKFICETVHPVVRPEISEAKTLVENFNEALAADGWELVEGNPISGKPTFVPRRCASGVVSLPDPIHEMDVLSDEYVRELASKCDSRLASEDFDGAVTVARTLLETILSKLETRITGAKGKYKGDLPKQFKQVTKLLRMDEQRKDLDDRFKDVIRGLVMIANGLTPLRNKMSDGHARERKPAPHHARVVVNAAKTVSIFLVESYTFQKGKGLIQDIASTLQGD